MEEIKQINEIKEKLFNKQSGELHISRVPLGTLEHFKRFSKSEFCDDRGMALKYLVDELLVKPPIYMNLQEQIYKLFEEFEELKSSVSNTLSVSEIPNNSNKENEKKIQITRTDNGSRIIKRKCE